MAIVRKQCEGIGLTISVKAVNEFVGSFKHGETTVGDVLEALKTVEKTIRWEMEEQTFFHLPAKRAEFYKNATLAFGEPVNDSFPHAIADIEEAAKCLALSRGTACVFHSMRVMETGLRAVAKWLDIPYAPSWESYIRQIETRIGENHSKKARSWQKDESFFKDVLGDLQAVKIAWRNPTMHVVRSYTPEEAEQIFGVVKMFMQRVASHQKKKPIKKTKEVGSFIIRQVK